MSLCHPTQHLMPTAGLCAACWSQRCRNCVNVMYNFPLRVSVQPQHWQQNFWTRTFLFFCMCQLKSFVDGFFLPNQLKNPSFHYILSCFFIPTAGLSGISLNNALKMDPFVYCYRHPYTVYQRSKLFFCHYALSSSSSP